MFNSSKSVDGVPSEFVMNIGQFINSKFFVDSRRLNKKLYSYGNVKLGYSSLQKIIDYYDNYRTIIFEKSIRYEFYKENDSYLVIDDAYTIKELSLVSSIGFEEYHELIKTCRFVDGKFPKINWVTGIDNNGNLVIKKYEMKHKNEFVQDFYPCLKGVSIEDYAKKYVESNSSIIILIGPPGTGKTNFIRHLLMSTGESVLMTHSDDLKRTDVLFSHFYDSPEKFLVLEDADTFVVSREKGNDNMKQLLNIADGLTANPNKKVIITVNLPTISQVDDALIRPGRCYSILRFDAFGGDTLINAADHIGVSDKIDESKKYTLAELYSIKNEESIMGDILEESTSKKVGF